jgi:hypothetical protein
MPGRRKRRVHPRIAALMIMGLQLASPSINLWTPVFEQVDAVSGGRVALGLHSAAGLSWAPRY